MTDPTISFIQINLHHSKSASAVLARCAAGMHTSHLLLIQEPWLIKGCIKGLGGCGKLFKANNSDRLRTCIIVKGLDAYLLPQFSNGDLVAIQLKLKLTDGVSLHALRLDGIAS